MLKSKKKSSNVEDDGAQDPGSKMLEANDEQHAPSKKTLIEHFRSERMRVIVKYLGRL